MTLGDAYSNGAQPKCSSSLFSHPTPEIVLLSLHAWLVCQFRQSYFDLDKALFIFEKINKYEVGEGRVKLCSVAFKIFLTEHEFCLENKICKMLL